MSRTDLSGLAEYFSKDLDTLADLGCPVDPKLFVELVRAEDQLGPVEPISSPMASEVASGVSVSISISYGTRRTGFGVLHDIISRHRRAWAAMYLDTYLRARWETEIRDAARDFGLLYERKGRPPTAKQFATHAAAATNHWFGGDISGLYGMIGETAPLRPVRKAIMPSDREAFAQTVLESLTHRLIMSAQTPAAAPYSRESQERGRIQLNLTHLAERSLELVQQEEARGRPVTLAEFGYERFAYRVKEITSEIEMAWVLYLQAIEDARRPAETLQGLEVAQPSSTETTAYKAHAPVDGLDEDSPDRSVGNPEESRPWRQRFLNRT